MTGKSYRLRHFTHQWLVLIRPVTANSGTYVQADLSLLGWLLVNQTGFYARELAVDELVR
jgi:hypothetical protein